ncbi:NUDIX hydrolase [Phycisphaerales bacterium AB-hyl4]|uniref:GDP-mannose pyrophosphatase n=1 Tax=Natronomicrosphaera hydrolytica TaxID=3242702 RepID=A0ABV4UA50_9BACT
MPKPTWPSEQRVFEGVRFDVMAVGYPRRGGGEQRREVVVPADAVVVLPVLDDDRVVLIRNERFAVGETLWELPAGTVEEGEDPDACAGRELTEETGYTAERIVRLTRFYSSPGFCTEQMTLYLAQGLAFEGQNLDETERIVVEPVSWDEAMAMTADGRICDAKTIAGLLFYAQFVRGRG